MMTTAIRFFHDDTGTTAIEYALIAALVSIAGITALTLLGSEVLAMFTAVATDLGTAVTP